MPAEQIKIQIHMLPTRWLEESLRNTACSAASQIILIQVMLSPFL